MTVDISTVVTDWDWAEDIRPEIRLPEADGKHFATLSASRQPQPPELELSGERDDLASQLEGYAEIFTVAAQLLRQHLQRPEKA